MKEHHAKCPKAQAWDIANVPCGCPNGWPRKIAHSKSEFRRLTTQGVDVLSPVSPEADLIAKDEARWDARKPCGCYENMVCNECLRPAQGEIAVKERCKCGHEQHAGLACFVMTGITSVGPVYCGCSDAPSAHGEGATLDSSAIDSALAEKGLSDLRPVVDELLTAMREGRPGLERAPAPRETPSALKQAALDKCREDGHCFYDADNTGKHRCTVCGSPALMLTTEQIEALQDAAVRSWLESRIAHYEAEQKTLIEVVVLRAERTALASAAEARGEEQ